MDMRVERTARAIIPMGSYVLLSRDKTEQYWVLPGGHIENGEVPADAVKRELWEETGREVSRLSYLTTLQNDFDKQGVHIQEEMWVYRADLTPILRENPAQSKEDWLEFAWAPIVDIAMWHVMPPAVVPFIQLVGGG